MFVNGAWLIPSSVKISWLIINYNYLKLRSFLGDIADATSSNLLFQFEKNVQMVWSCAVRNTDDRRKLKIWWLAVV